MSEQETAAADRDRDLRRIWPVVGLVAFLAPAIRMLPNVWGYLYETPGRVFLGLGFLPNDFRSYASFISQARETGRFFLHNEFTLQPQNGRYVLLFQWLVGRFAAITGSDVPLAWWLIQLTAGTGLLIAVWRLLRAFFEDTRERFLCFMLVAFSGGLEWIPWATRRWLPNGLRDELLAVAWPLISWNTFESLFAPLSTLAFAGVVLLLWLVLHRDGQPGRGRIAIGSLLVLLIYATHGYTAVGLAGILGTTLVLGVARRRWPRRSLPAESVPLLVLCLSFALPFGLCLWQMQDPVFASSLGHAAMAEKAHRVWLWPLTQGLVLALSIVGLPTVWRRDDAPSRLLLGWLGGTTLLANLPFFSPSRFLFLVHLPLCIAATIGIAVVRERGPAWMRARTTRVAAMFALFATNATVVPMSLIEVRDDPYRYLSRAEFDVMDRMQHLDRGGVLAGAVSATYLPWLARHPVYLGHWFLTPDIEARAVLMRRFFSGRETPSWSEAFLRDNGIRYVYVGPLERSLGRLDPALPLERVIDGEGVEVYRVR